MLREKVVLGVVGLNMVLVLRVEGSKKNAAQPYP